MSVIKKIIPLALAFFISSLSFAQNSTPFDMIPAVDKNIDKKSKKRILWYAKKHENKTIKTDSTFTKTAGSNATNKSLSENSRQATKSDASQQTEFKKTGEFFENQPPINESQEDIHSIPSYSLKNNPFGIAPKASKNKIQKNHKEDSEDYVNINPDVPYDHSTDSRVTVVYENLQNTPIKLEKEIQQADGNNLFLFWFLLVMALGCSIIIYIERSLISNIFRALSNNNFLDLLYRKRNATNNLIYALLYLLYFLNAGLFLHLSFQYFKDTSGPKLITVTTIFLLTIYLIKHFVLHILAWTFSLERSLKVYNFSIVIFNVVIGILLIPINFFIAFGTITTLNFFMYTGLIMIALLLILRTIRAFRMTYPIASQSRFHFILYLCNVENFPILVLLKYAVIM